jgi:AcrR family transcriptional regulator
MTRRAGLNREQVIQAAAELADREGLEALSLAALAAHLNIRTPSLYNHVDGLPGLRRDLALLGLREQNARMGQAGIGRTGADAVLAVASAYREFILTHPGLHAAIMLHAGKGAEDDEAIQAASDEAVKIVLAVLSAFNLQGEDALHAVRGLRSIVHGFATLELSGGFGMPISIDESFRRLVQMFVRGLEDCR